MSGKLIHRLAIGLLVATSVFFGFVLAAAFNLILPKEVGEALQLPFVQRGPVQFTEGQPEGVDYPLSGPNLNESPGDLPTRDFMQIAESAKAAVVNISSISTRGETAGSGAEGGPKFGSGILLDPDGYILTNWHVVEDSDKVLITMLNGNRYSAQIVGADPLTDLALLKVFPRDKLPSAVLGDSDTVKPGEWVMAIGHPSGLNHTITVGVVSAVGRDFDINAAFRNFIQTDAAINPGNSGGPLLNRRGEVIGINSAIFQGTQNLGFAIPINMAKLVIEQLRQSGRVRRGYLGLQPESISEDLREAFGLPDRKGALVTNVVRRLEDGQAGPAYEAGIRIGDIITSFDGRKIDSVDQLYILAAYTQPGKTVRVEVLRDGRKTPLSVTLSSRQDERPVRLPSTRRISGRYPLGLNVAPLDSGARNSLRRITEDEFTTGVLVLDVEVGSNSYDKGIMPGDIITTVSGRPVSGEEEFADAVGSAFTGGQFAVLYVIPRIDSSQRRFVAVHK
jgi:serine protease Do